MEETSDEMMAKQSEAATAHGERRPQGTDDNSDEQAQTTDDLILGPGTEQCQEATDDISEHGEEHHIIIHVGQEEVQLVATDGDISGHSEVIAISGHEEEEAQAIDDISDHELQPQATDDISDNGEERPEATDDIIIHVGHGEEQPLATNEIDVVADVDSGDNEIVVENVVEYRGADLSGPGESGVYELVENGVIDIQFVEVATQSVVEVLGRTGVAMTTDDDDGGADDDEYYGPNLKSLQELQHTCYICGQLYHTKGGLNRHMLTHTRQGVNETGKKFTCQICDRVYSTRSGLTRHSAIHTDGAHKCSDCSKLFDSKSGLDRHRFMHLGIYPHKCEQCDKVFKQKVALETHVRINHTGEKPYACDKCTETFSCRANLTNHLRVKHNSTGIPPFKCEVCGKGFDYKSSLEKHQRIHTGERPFVCHVCGQTFASQTPLRYHLNIHSEGEKFHCPVCHKKFNQKHGMERHLLVHTGIKAHQCEHCGKRFAVKIQLKNHVNCVHLQIARFVCPFKCGKAFRSEKSLRVHKASHSGERKYLCRFCGKAYTQCYSMRVHERKVHPVDYQLAAQNRDYSDKDGEEGGVVFTSEDVGAAGNSEVSMDVELIDVTEECVSLKMEN